MNLQGQKPWGQPFPHGDVLLEKFSCCLWCFSGSGLSLEGTVTPAPPCMCFFPWIFAFGKSSLGKAPAVRLNTCHCVTGWVFSLCTGLGMLQSQLSIF